MASVDARPSEVENVSDQAPQVDPRAGEPFALPRHEDAQKYNGVMPRPKTGAFDAVIKSGNKVRNRAWLSARKALCCPDKGSQPYMNLDSQTIDLFADAHSI